MNSLVGALSLMVLVLGGISNLDAMSREQNTKEEFKVALDKVYNKKNLDADELAKMQGDFTAAVKKLSVDLKDFDEKDLKAAKWQAKKIYLIGFRLLQYYMKTSPERARWMKKTLVSTPLFTLINFYALEKKASSEQKMKYLENISVDLDYILEKVKIIFS